MSHKVAAVVLPGVLTFDLGCAIQVFGDPPVPGPTHGRYDLRVCGPGRRVRAADGIGLTLQHGLDAMDEADTVLVIGYSTAVTGPPPPAVVQGLRRAAERGARMGSICVGAFALAHAGLLDRRRATTHWAAAGALAEQFPDVEVLPNALYVQDGPVLTSAGAAAGFDLGLHIVRHDHGIEAATEVARWNVMAPHRAGGQAQFIRRPLVADLAEVATGTAATREWALQRLAESLTLAGLAEHACCSERTLTRRFLADTGTTPKQWLNTARADRARNLLETTDLAIERVATEAGFPSAAALRDCFTTMIGTTPTAYRRTFRATARGMG
ncbi:MAG TPA: helix-turn-helix domain-containing protein [Pseudonocardiaceae bacterium]|jgi:transcriptional regulator GlxA family with amidase domain|nr:helix-turn-helix domain-containing protein [Pseudonocardiaceae bacterium]